MTRISAVVVTRNAAATLALTLRSVHSWTDETIVVDMHSDDGTRDVARRYGAQVHLHDQVGYADPARASAVGRASGDWVIMLDADEVVAPRVAKALVTIADRDSADAVLIPWRNHMLGAEALRGPFAPTRDQHLRFFKPWALALSPDPHTKPVVAPTARVCALPVEDELLIDHFAHRDLSELLQRADRYTSRQAALDVEAGRVASTPRAVVRACRQFGSGYLRHRGWRGGWRGFHLSVFMAYYELIRQAKGRQLLEVGDAETVGRAYRARAEALLEGYARPEEVDRC